MRLYNFLMTMPRRSKFAFFVRALILVGNGFFLEPACAGPILQIREHYVLFEPDVTAKPTDQFAALDEYGETAAILVVEKVKGSRAVGKILSGNPQLGQNVVYLAPYVSGKNLRWPEKAWSFGGAFRWASVPVNPGASISGTAVEVYASWTGFAAPWLAFDLGFGTEFFNARGSDQRLSCGGTSNCYLKVDYLCAPLSVKFIPIPSWRVRPFLGAGIELKEPFFKSSNAIAESGLNFALEAKGELGLQALVHRGNYLELQGELSRINSQVAAITLYGLRGSFAWEW